MHNHRAEASPGWVKRSSRSATAILKFFIVKSGEIEIIDHSGDEPKTITIHRKGESTGDISHLTGSPAIFSAIGRGDCEVFEISGEALQNVLDQVPGFGPIAQREFCDWFYVTIEST